MSFENQKKIFGNALKALPVALGILSAPTETRAQEVVFKNPIKIEVKKGEEPESEIPEWEKDQYEIMFRKLQDEIHNLTGVYVESFSGNLNAPKQNKVKNVFGQTRELKLKLDSLDFEQRLDVYRFLRVYTLRYPPNILFNKLARVIFGGKLNSELPNGAYVEIAGYSTENNVIYVGLSMSLVKIGDKKQITEFDTLFNHEMGHNFFTQDEFKQEKWMSLVSSKYFDLYKTQIPKESFKYNTNDKHFAGVYDKPVKRGFFAQHSEYSHLEDFSHALQILMSPSENAKYLKDVASGIGIGSDKVVYAKYLVAKDLISSVLSLPGSYFEDAQKNEVRNSLGQIDLEKTAVNWELYWKRLGRNIK